MSIGSMVRRAFGPAEPAIASAYRKLFFDTADFVNIVRRWTEGRTMAAALDVGCGEGQTTAAFAQAFPEARFLGIDVTPHVGRHYRGGTERVQFRNVRLEEIADQQPEMYDLVMITDVLHHVSVQRRQAFMAAAGRTVHPGGLLVLKDWEKSWNPAHLASFVSDRFISGDAGVRFCTLAELREHLAAAGVGDIAHEARVRPWRNNIALAARRAPRVPGGVPPMAV
jgi:2-polyprenyl-6-hydroxyphenyl methylase/3-demethylubiquinone-9 3-methyltransferase